MVALLEDWDEAAVETTAAVVDELVEPEDPAEAQPESNVSIMAASNHLMASDLAESRTLHLPLLDVRKGPAPRINTEVECAEAPATTASPNHPTRDLTTARMQSASL